MVGLVGPNGAGQDHPAAAWPSGCWRRPPARSRCSAARPGGRPGAAGPGRVRRPGHPDLRRAVGRRPPAARRAAQPGLGRRAGARPDRAARPGPGAEGREAVRRAARPARADPGRRQAARAADPRRAGGQPRPAGPARVPAGPDGGRRRAASVSVVLSSHLVADLERVCDYLIVLVASRVRVAGRGRRAAGHPPPADRPAPRPGRAARRACEVIAASHTDRQTTLLVRTDGPILDPAWTVDAGQPGGPGARLHEPGRRTARRRQPRTWRCGDDLADLAPVPRPGHHRGRGAGRVRDPARGHRAAPGQPVRRQRARRLPRRQLRGRWPATSSSRLDAAGALHDRCTCSASRSSSLAPALIGIFWGAPLIARELETGTSGWPGTRASPAPAGWRSSSR